MLTVDDERPLSELYATWLEGGGYGARRANDRLARVVAELD